MIIAKELFKKLKGQYDTYVVFNHKFRDSAPFTMLGEEFNSKEGKAFQKVLYKKKVVDYHIESKKTLHFTVYNLLNDIPGKWEVQRILYLYIEV